jgi:hypothetical protein
MNLQERGNPALKIKKPFQDAKELHRMNIFEQEEI